MGYDLTSDTRDDARWGVAEWPALLRLADRFGWEPQGPEPWPGTALLPGWEYLVNDGQHVRATDARNLADALERALADIPDHDALADIKRTLREWPDPDGVGVWRVVAYSADPGSRGTLARFSGPRKDDVRAFIAFCRLGGFTIA
jgi:hypothetical protein